MAAHDVLYKYVEELTGEPVDHSKYRPSFTGAMAALDAAITGITQKRKETISKAIKSHLDNDENGGDDGGDGDSVVDTVDIVIGNSQQAPTNPSWFTAVISTNSELIELEMLYEDGVYSIPAVPVGSMLSFIYTRPGYGNPSIFVQYAVARGDVYYDTYGPILFRKSNSWSEATGNGKFNLIAPKLEPSCYLEVQLIFP